MNLVIVSGTKPSSEDLHQYQEIEDIELFEQLKLIEFVRFTSQTTFTKDDGLQNKHVLLIIFMIFNAIRIHHAYCLKL